MYGGATILHADVDSFFASVEQRDDPRLRGRPVIVGPGVVMAASYEARAQGVRSAMGAAQARRLCPQAIFVEARFQAYVAASKELFGVFEDVAPVVEGVSMEEAFLDVRGLERIAGPPLAIAVRLRRRVREQVGLPITVGIATTKTIAKVASGVAKPDGLLLVHPGRELSFLRPLPVGRLWGVGPATAARLRDQGITVVGDLAARTEPELVAMLGRASGRSVHALARNRDPRRVRARGRRSIGSQHAFGLRTRPFEQLDPILISLVDRVARRMRAAGRAGRTVVLRLRFGDYSRASRSHTLAHATAATATLLAVARALLAAVRPMIERRGATMIGLTITNLDSGAGATQLELPLWARPGALDTALDELRGRFGSDVVTRASLLGRGRRLRPTLQFED